MHVYSGKLLLLKINKIDLKYAVYDELYTMNMPSLFGICLVLYLTTFSSVDYAVVNLNLVVGRCNLR